MAKTKAKAKPTRTKKSVAKFCWNCSQPVAGKIAEMSARIGVVYCCNCRRRLDANGNCPNLTCPFYGTVPQC